MSPASHRHYLTDRERWKHETSLKRDEVERAGSKHSRKEDSIVWCGHVVKLGHDEGRKLGLQPWPMSDCDEVTATTTLLLCAFFASSLCLETM